MKTLGVVLFISIVIMSAIYSDEFADKPWSSAPNSDIQILESSDTKIAFRCEWHDVKNFASAEKKFVVVIPPATNLNPEILNYEIGVSKDGEITDEVITKNNSTGYPEFEKQLVPSTLIKVSELGYVRNYKLALVKITGKLSIYGPQKTYRFKSIEGNLLFDKSYENFEKNKSTDFKDNYFINLISATIANKEGINAYRDNNPPYVDSPPSSFDKYYQQKGKWLKIDVDKETLIKIKGESILKLFLMKNCLNEDIHIYNKNAEIPIYFVDFNNNGIFETEDCIIFLGYPETTQYTHHNIYWLSIFKDKKVERIQRQQEIARESNPAYDVKAIDYEQLFEEDKANLLEGKILEGQDILWYWEKFDEGSEITKDFNLPELSNPNPTGKIILNFYNASTSLNNKHQIEVTINGELKKEIFLNKLKAFNEKFEIPANLLKEKGNKISFKISQRIKTTPPEATPTVPTPTPSESNPPPPRETQNSNNQSAADTFPEIYLDNFQITYKRNLSIGKEYFAFSYNKESEKAEANFQFKIPEGVSFVGFDVTNKLKPVFLSFQPATDGFSFSIQITEIKKVVLSAIDAILEAKIEVDERSDLRNTQNNADLIIIYHPLFENAAKRLEEFKNKNGILTKIVNVQDIYDEFNYGIFSPESIKGFLSYALKDWSESKLKYVLLIGDATWDYLGEYRNGIINYVPSYTKLHSIENFACDLWFTNLIGNDSLPELEIGRISVNNKDDAENVADKIINYEKNENPQEWQRHFGYIADDSQGFDTICDKIIEQTPQAFVSDKVYLDNYRFEDNFYVPKEKLGFLRDKNKVSPDCNNAIKEMFDTGVTLVEFYGHGAPNIWADERIWFGGDSKHSDNLRLINKDRLFFIVQMTCSTSTIDYPIKPWNVCIGEDMLRVKNGGAIGVFSPSGKGYTNWHERISLYMRQAIFEHNLKMAGDIIFNTQLSYFALEDSPDMIEMFLLLGDPTISLPIPELTLKVNPQTVVTTPEEKNDLTFECSTESFSDGKASVSLYNPDDELVGEEKTYEIKNGKFNFTENIQQNPKEGRWLIRIYAVNNDKTKESVGSVEIFVSKPNIEISKLTITPSEGQYNPDSKVTINTLIKNNSKLTFQDVKLELLDKGFEDESQIASETLSFKPEEEVNRSYEYQIKNGVRDIIAKLFLTYSGKNLTVSKNEIIQCFSTSTTPDLTTLASTLNLEDKDFYEDAAINLNFKVFNIGNTDVNDVKVRILDKDKNPVSVVGEIKKISPNNSAPLSLKLNNIYKKGMYNFLLQIDPDNQITESNKDNNIVPFEIQVTGNPDLVITPEDIRLDNDGPTDGTTVFMYVTVHNKGESTARKVRVDSYLDDPNDNGKFLRSKVVNKNNENFDIEPGESKIFTIRWDPTENAGLHKLYFKALSSQLPEEKDTTNNIAYKELKVKTKIDLIAGKLELSQTPEDIVNLRLKLKAEIENKGETDAVGVVINYYKYHEQTDENFIGRTDVDVIKGGEKKIVEYVWQIDRKDADVKFKPSFNVGLQSSSQLSQGYAEPPEEKKDKTN